MVAHFSRHKSKIKLGKTILNIDFTLNSGAVPSSEGFRSAAELHDLRPNTCARFVHRVHVLVESYQGRR